jgi:hypothetical protein
MSFLLTDSIVYKINAPVLQVISFVIKTLTICFGAEHERVVG